MSRNENEECAIGFQRWVRKKQTGHEYSMQRNQLKRVDMRREDGSSIVELVVSPTALLCAVDDGKGIEDDDDNGSSDDEDEDEDSKVENLGVGDEIGVIDVVTGCGDGVESVPMVIVEVDDELCDRVREGGMGFIDVAEGRGDPNDPDMPVSLRSLVSIPFEQDCG